MKTTILTTTLIFVLNASGSVSASNTSTDQLQNTAETQNISLLESLGRNNIEKRHNTYSQEAGSLRYSVNTDNVAVAVKLVNKNSNLNTMPPS